MYELACETVDKCDTDQYSFKAYLSRWMAATTKMAPWTYDKIIDRLKTSATAAALQCSGGSNGRTCGVKWTNNGTYDGNSGIGQQMSALEVVQSTLIQQVSAPLTNTTGGTSKGNPDAGTASSTTITGDTTVVTIGDKIGAGVLTTGVIVGVVGGAWWVIT